MTDEPPAPALLRTVEVRCAKVDGLERTFADVTRPGATKVLRSTAHHADAKVGDEGVLEQWQHPTFVSWYFKPKGVDRGS